MNAEQEHLLFAKKVINRRGPMEGFVFVFIIAAFAFWLGRRTKTIPDQVNDPFNGSPIQSASKTPEGEVRVAMNGQRAFILIFISGWLMAWTAGIVMVGLAFVNSLGAGFVTVFLAGWLIAAIGGWFFAATTIYKLATGKPVRLRSGEMF